MPTDPRTIADGMVVSMHYTLKDDEGEVLDSSREDGEAFAYLHGHGNIVPGLEKALVGLAPGAKLEVVVPPEEGYGAIESDGPEAVDRAAFPPDAELFPGMPLVAESEDGHDFTVFVVEVKDDVVLVDTDHPLAGENLHFEVEVLDVREATAVELSHGHPHGPDGHGHHHH